MLYLRLVTTFYLSEQFCVCTIPGHYCVYTCFYQKCVMRSCLELLSLQNDCHFLHEKSEKDVVDSHYFELLFSWVINIIEEDADETDQFVYWVWLANWFSLTHANVQKQVMSISWGTDCRYFWSVTIYIWGSWKQYWFNSSSITHLTTISIEVRPWCHNK